MAWIRSSTPCWIWIRNEFYSFWVTVVWSYQTLFVCGDMHFVLDSYLDFAPSLGAFGVHWHIWKWFWIICTFFLVRLWFDWVLCIYGLGDVLSRWRLVNDLYFGGLQMSFVRLDGIQAKVEICRIWLELGVWPLVGFG